MKTARIPPRESSPKKFLFISITILLSTIVVGGFLEVFVRLTFKDVVLFNRFHTAANYDGFTLRRLRPNTTFYHSSRDGRWRFITNRQGFRDTKDYEYKKLPSEFRVIVLGDSHMQGFEVRQQHTLSAVLERILKKKGMAAQVLNTGISGFSTAEQLAFIESEGIRYQPDAIVLGLFGNDFDDNIKSGLYQIVDGELKIVKTSHIPGVNLLDIHNAIPPLRWLSQNSHFYSLLFNTIWNFAKKLLLSSAEQKMKQEVSVSPDVTSIQQAKIELAKSIIIRLKNAVNKVGARLIIVDIPGRKNALEAKSSIPPVMRSFLKNKSDHLIHFDDVLASYQGTTEFHVPHGQHHINELTHFLLANAIADELSGVKTIGTQ